MNRDEMIAFAEEAGIKIDKRWSDEKILAAIDEAVNASAPSLVSDVLSNPSYGLNHEASALHVNELMNAYALRIWEGQSPDLPIRQRVERITSGLRGQGYEDLSGLTLPTKEDIKRYL